MCKSLSGELSCKWTGLCFRLHVHQRQEQWMRPLLVRIFWSPSYHIVLNSRCRELLDLMKEVLIALRTNGQAKQKESLVRFK